MHGILNLPYSYHYGDKYSSHHSFIIINFIYFCNHAGCSLHFLPSYMFYVILYIYIYIYRVGKKYPTRVAKHCHAACIIVLLSVALSSFSRHSLSERGLTWDFQVVSRISDDWTIPSEASGERIELNTAVGLGAQ